MPKSLYKLRIFCAAVSFINLFPVTLQSRVSDVVERSSSSSSSSARKRSSSDAERDRGDFTVRIEELSETADLVKTQILDLSDDELKDLLGDVDSELREATELASIKLGSTDGELSEMLVKQESEVKDGKSSAEADVESAEGRVEDALDDAQSDTVQAEKAVSNGMESANAELSETLRRAESELEQAQEYVSDRIERVKEQLAGLKGGTGSGRGQSRTSIEQGLNIIDQLLKYVKSRIDDPDLDEVKLRIDNALKDIQNNIDNNPSLAARIIWQVQQMFLERITRAKDPSKYMDAFQLFNEPIH